MIETNMDPSVSSNENDLVQSTIPTTGLTKSESSSDNENSALIAMLLLQVKAIENQADGLQSLMMESDMYYNSFENDEDEIAKINITLETLEKEVQAEQKAGVTNGPFQKAYNTIKEGLNNTEAKMENTKNTLQELWTSQIQPVYQGINSEFNEGGNLISGLNNSNK